MFLITYSFDSDYVAHICENREQAEKIREYYLQEEIKTLEEEQEYTPAVDKTDPDCWIMFYDHEGSTDEDPDTADYRIIDGTHHCAVAEQELKKLHII